MFLGHHLSSAGIKPSPSKVAALSNFRAPKTKEELKSFLGLVTYIGKFLPDLGTKTDDLRQLTKNKVLYEWNPEHEQAFQLLKTCISDPRTLNYFDPTRHTRLIADASPVALGAVLVQIVNGDPRPIEYASKTLTMAERRYCQTEKEALVLVWAVERFQMYLRAWNLNWKRTTIH